MADKLTAVMVGEDIEQHGIYYVTEDEDSLIRFQGSYPMGIQMAYGVNAMKLEYDIGHFTVNTGNQKFIQGCYPYFTSEGWLEADNYEKFYFGGLMLKVDGRWYIADWVNPDENQYEVVTFIRMDSLKHAFTAALKMAMNSYVNKTA